MMGHQPETFVSFDEWFEAELTAETKSEYLDGQIFAMTGASLTHNLLVGNVFASLKQKLKGKKCTALPSDMKIKVSATGLCAYPDVSVYCGEPKFEGSGNYILLNPVLICEVLSDSTEAWDRGAKFGHYRKLDSLKEYLLVSQHERKIEKFTRDGAFWVLSETTDDHTVLELSSLGISMTLAEVYEDIN